MKKLLSITFAAMMMALLAGCTAKDITIFEASDIHYLSQQLTDNSPAFVEMLGEGDGKMTHYIDPIVNAFVDDVIEKKPDFLFISGDMTFNGEKMSHIDLVEKLEKVRNAGITVLVIPGNHDIDYPFSMAFEGEYTFPTDRFLKTDYEEVYKEYGLSKATSRDEETLSYFYPLSKDIQVLMLDVNTGVKFGTASDKTVQWVKTNLEAATAKGIRTIAVSHQTLLEHSDTLTQGFAISNGEQLAEIYRANNVKLSLCGHTHVQHIADSDKKLFDIVTSSMAVYPSQYGIINIKPDTFDISYHTEKVKVAQWAEKNGIEDENLKNFESYALDFFTDVSYYKSLKQLEEIELTTQEREEMAMLFAQMNNYYFPGNLHEIADEIKNSVAYDLWQKTPGLERRSKYITGALNQARLDHTQLTI